MRRAHGRRTTGMDLESKVMKFLVMADRNLADEYPPQEVEWTAVEAFRKHGAAMPLKQKGWRRPYPTHIEISQEQFPGAVPIWFWEA